MHATPPKKGPEIKHFIIPQMQKHLTQGGVKFTYEFRLKKKKKKPEIKNFQLTNCKLFLGKVAYKLQTHIIPRPTYKFRLTKGLK